jgi:colanic acid/amylovoran biosynthesis glycosyltransferase
MSFSPAVARSDPQPPAGAVTPRPDPAEKERDGSVAELLDAKREVTAEGIGAEAAPAVRTAIAVVMTYFPRIDETYILREINELERQGQPVVVVPIVREYAPLVHEEAKPWVQRALFTPFLSREIIASNLRALFSTPRRYLGLLWTLVRGTFWRPSTLIRSLSVVPKAVHLARILPKRGIRHVHSHFATHASTLAYAIASMSDISFSFTVHGPDVFVHRLLLREKLHKAKFIRCVSTFNKAFLSGLYPHLTEGKLHVVRTGVNPDVYDEAARRPAPPRLRPKLLSVAALTPRNGFPFLIDACSRLMAQGIEVDCSIVGDGPLRAATEVWIAEHGLEGRVRILGNLPQHEVARLMGETDIFVLPSIIASDGQMDGIPVSLMEAMAAGKPVVAAALSGIPELVKHQVNGLLVDAAHPQRIADAVRRLVEEPALRIALGAAAKNTVREHFDARKTAQSLMRLLDRTEEVNKPLATTAERIQSLNWNRMNATAIGVRQVHDRQYSYLAEVTIRDGSSTKEVIVRQHCGATDEDARDRARTEFESLTTLREAMTDSDLADRTATAATCTVPRLLMFDEPNAAIVIERADGKSLAGIMQEAARGEAGRLAPALRKAGTWLRVLHHHTRSSEDSRHTVTGVVLLALRDVDLASAGDRALARHRDAIRERLQKLESVVNERSLDVVGHHGNFRPENIFIGSRRIEVVDFGDYREGLAMEDVAELLIHLELDSSTRRVPALRRAVLDGVSGGTTPDEDVLALFTMTRTLKMLARDGVADRERPKVRELLLRCLG